MWLVTRVCMQLSKKMHRNIQYPTVILVPRLGSIVAPYFVHLIEQSTGLSFMVWHVGLANETDASLQ